MDLGLMRARRVDASGPTTHGVVAEAAYPHRHVRHWSSQTFIVRVSAHEGFAARFTASDLVQPSLHALRRERDETWLDG
jgi:hypothetical protein